MLACFFCFGIGEYLLIMVGGLVAGMFCNKFKLKVRKMPCSCQMDVKQAPNSRSEGLSLPDWSQGRSDKTLAQIRDRLDLKDFTDSF